MLRSYLILAWRNLFKNKLSAIINIAGLALGLAIVILTYLTVDDMFGYDRFHKNYADLCVLMKTERKTDVGTGSSIPGRVAEAVRAGIPEILYASHGTFDNSLLRVGNRSIYQQALYADPDFFRMMTYPAISGDPTRALLDPGAVVLTESTAKKLFGNENAVGQMISHNNMEQLKVAAVIQDVPEQSSNHFDLVLPFAAFEKQVDWLDKWDDNRLLTWVQLKPGANLAEVNRKLTDLLQKKANDKKVELFAYPLREAWLRNSFRNGKPTGGRIQAIVMLELVGGFVLLVACINFMNLSTARSERRGREVGVRKTMGATRRSLIFQFLSEALLLTFFSMLVGLMLAKFFLPSFNLFIQKHLTLDFASPKIWLATLLIGVSTSLLAGIYPAFFLSRFNPVQVLKGVFLRSRSGLLLRKGLVTFQFMITILLIISVIAVLRQKDYVRERPIGYDKENLIKIFATGDMADKFNLVRQDLSRIPGVVAVSGGSDDLTSFGAGTDGISWPGKTAADDFYVTVSSVCYDWVKTTGLQLVEGRDFSPAFGTDTAGYLLNETAVRRMHLKPPVVGTRLGNRVVVGVVKDFVFNDVFNKPAPLAVDLGTGKMNVFFVRFANVQGWQQTIKAVEKVVKKTNPNYPFEYHFMSDDYERKFHEIQTTADLLNVTGVLAILISCLGLFGLSVFLAEQRRKEIGIRKVLGASLAGIWTKLCADFLKPVAIAFLIAAPLGGWMMKSFLDHFDYHTSLNGWIFLLAGSIAFLIAVVTVSFQGIRAAMANPVDSLRTND